MNDELRRTLDELLASGSDSNPALNALVDSYTEYHVVFIAVAGLFVVALALLAGFAWRRSRRAPRPDGRRLSFERVTYLGVALSSALLSLLMGLLVAANLSNVVDPQRGFSGAVGMIGPSPAGSSDAELHRAFASWLQSGAVDVPALVDETIDQRLAWQRPKAIVCAMLLVGFVVLGAAVWRGLIRRSRARQGRWRLSDVALLGAGILLGPVCVLLMVMVIGNTQAAWAPLSMTLFYG